MRDHVLCNVAAAVEDLPGDRNAVTRRVLRDADRIVLVADATCCKPPAGRWTPPPRSWSSASTAAPA